MSFSFFLVFLFVRVGEIGADKTSRRLLDFQRFCVPLFVGRLEIGVPVFVEVVVLVGIFERLRFFRFVLRRRVVEVVVRQIVVVFEKHSRHRRFSLF